MAYLLLASSSHATQACQDGSHACQLSGAAVCLQPHSNLYTYVTLCFAFLACHPAVAAGAGSQHAAAAAAALPQANGTSTAGCI